MAQRHGFLEDHANRVRPNVRSVVLRQSDDRYRHLLDHDNQRLHDDRLRGVGPWPASLKPHTRWPPLVNIGVAG